MPTPQTCPRKLAVVWWLLQQELQGRRLLHHRHLLPNHV
jgi:hypothetical protein